MVFHEAAIPSVPRSIDDPVPSHEVNIDGTFNVLRAAATGGVGRVVYAASSSAYGDTRGAAEGGDHDAAVRNRPTRCRNWWANITASIFASIFGLETVAMRYFNVYGPRQDPSSQYSGVLSLFIKAVWSAPPTIFGDGEQSRDFTYVEDVVELNLKAARAPGVSGKIYNGGNGGRITLNQAWALVQKIEGVEIPANYGPPRAGDVRDSQADTTAAVRDLGHAPRYSFAEGLRLTLEWYKTQQHR